MTRAMDKRSSASPLAEQELSIQQLVEYTGFSEPELAEMVKPGGVAAGVDNAGLITFCLGAHARGLDPRLKQCFYIQRAGKWTFTTSIDGASAIAQRSGKFAGVDPPNFRGQLEVDNPNNRNQPIIAPEEAEVTVWALVGVNEQVRPFRAVCHWQEYYPGSGDVGFMWRKMPRRMLGKCATMQALRLAFPQQLGDVELLDDESRTVEVTPNQVRVHPESAPNPPQLEQPKRTYDDIFPDDDQARSDRETAKAKGIVDRAQAAARANDEAAQQRQLEIAEVDRQRREEGLR